MVQRKNQDLLQFIAQRLKELRQLKGLSQEDVFNDTEIHIARIETGKLNITVSTLAQLCEYFGTNLPEFFRQYAK